MLSARVKSRWTFVCWEVAPSSKSRGRSGIIGEQPNRAGAQTGDAFVTPP
jgi:hypothetical protein